MAVPISQMFTVASYVLKKRLSGEKRYPLVLMLENVLSLKDITGCSPGYRWRSTRRASDQPRFRRLRGARREHF